MARIEIVYFSGMGHTVHQAEAVRSGAATVAEARLWRLGADGSLPDGGWAALDAADAIVFGSPTYMGGPAWQMKRLADDSSGRWDARRWQDKLAGGFTTSASINGDKFATLMAFMTLAAQHGMLWVSLGQLPASDPDRSPQNRNWTGGNQGAMAVAAPAALPEDPLPEGDWQSAHDYGVRIAQLAHKLN
ncbi:flavodoxin family protein [Sulfitobacter sp. S190]|uniref:flavodoxin family protein n=1 Tax=Sulfitobacter sp. S190 TaxID=2867022 RepID=UPI0021A3AA07|nr:flavodoxin family protein [Sulfitobacter sp. S190]UWR23656.1 flavodoxin family protein [Sulfitobacter sp. S190]